jgi:hypothetical protein
LPNRPITLSSLNPTVIAAAVDADLTALRREAEALRQAYWADHQARSREATARARREGRRKAPGGLTLRLRDHGPGFYVYWVKRRLAGKSSTQTRTDHIAKGRGAGRYPLNTLLRHAAPWEADLVRAYEPRFAHLRALVKHLTVLRREAVALAATLANPATLAPSDSIDLDPPPADVPDEVYEEMLRQGLIAPGPGRGVRAGE